MLLSEDGENGYQTGKTKDTFQRLKNNDINYMDTEKQLQVHKNLNHQQIKNSNN